MWRSKSTWTWRGGDGGNSGGGGSGGAAANAAMVTIFFRGGSSSGGVRRRRQDEFNVVMVVAGVVEKRQRRFEVLEEMAVADAPVVVVTRRKSEKREKMVEDRDRSLPSLPQRQHKQFKWGTAATRITGGGRKLDDPHARHRRRDGACRRAVESHSDIRACRPSCTVAPHDRTRRCHLQDLHGARACNTFGVRKVQEMRTNGE